MIGYNQDIITQKEIFQEILRKNVILYDLIELCSNLSIKNYYVGAEAISQSVWNYQDEFYLNNDDHEKNLMWGIENIDFIYYDNKNLSLQGEINTKEKILEIAKYIPINITVKNQARAHILYQKKLGKTVNPFVSSEEGINNWATTATAVGVRLDHYGFSVYCPFGLNDLLGRIIRPNKTLTTKETYENKVTNWSNKWKDLKIINW